MRGTQVEVWYDEEADYLEVLFDLGMGTFEETPDDRVMKRVDAEGNILGFSILGVRAFKGSPLKIVLSSDDHD